MDFSEIIVVFDLSLVARNPVFGVSDQVSLKRTCSATEAS